MDFNIKFYMFKKAFENRILEVNRQRKCFEIGFLLHRPKMIFDVVMLDTKL